MTPSLSESTADGLPRERSRWLMALARVPAMAMAQACAAPLAAGLLLIVQAGLLARVLGGVVQGDPGVHGLSQWWGEGLAVAALVAVRAMLGGWGEHAGARASESIKFNLRRALFVHMLASGPQWTRERASGEVAAALLEHVDALDAFFSRYLPALIAASVLPLAFAVALMPVDVVAGLLLLLTAPLIPVFMALVGWGAQAAGRRHARALTRLAGFFSDRVRGAATLKMFGREAAETHTIEAAAMGIARRTQAVLRIAFLSSAVLEFFAALGVAGMAVYFGLSFLGFLDLRSTPLSLATGLFCLMMAPEAYAPLRQFAAHYHDRATAQAAASELARVFGSLPSVDTLSARAAPTLLPVASSGPSPSQSPTPSPTPSPTATPSPSPTPSPAGLACATDRSSEAAEADAVCMSAVTLSMGTRQMRGIDLAVARGERLAIMGESGVGKTTLLETLAGLRDAPQAGTIMLLGRPLSRWTRAELCQRVAYAGQRPYLFEGSLADNIRLGCPHASDEAVWAAAERAQVTGFCAEWPDGLATMLGARGQGLSGGQAHRVALARLYVRNPEVVLLDEPTAHLDAYTSERVMDALLDWSAHRALIVVTHAESVAQRCDRRLVMPMQAGELP